MPTNPLAIQHAVITEIAKQMFLIAKDKNYTQVQIPTKSIEPALVELGLTPPEIDKWTSYLHLEGYIRIDYAEDNTKMYIKMQRKGVSAALSEFFKEGYLQQIRENKIMKLERRVIKSNLTTNTTTRRNNILSPLFAGFAFVISAIGLIRELAKDRQQQASIEILKHQMTRQDSLLQIQQTHINSLLRVSAPRDTAKVGSATPIN